MFPYFTRSSVVADRPRDASYFRDAAKLTFSLYITFIGSRYEFDFDCVKDSPLCSRAEENPISRPNIGRMLIQRYMMIALT